MEGVEGNGMEWNGMGIHSILCVTQGNKTDKGINQQHNYQDSNEAVLINC